MARAFYDIDESIYGLKEHLYDWQLTVLSGTRETGDIHMTATKSVKRFTTC